MVAPHNSNIIEALEKGADTIDRIRKEMEYLAVKAEAFDTITRLISALKPRTSGGFEPDASYIMRDLARELRKETVVPKSDT